jgi:predicted metalloprotease
MKFKICGVLLMAAAALGEQAGHRQDQYGQNNRDRIQTPHDGVTKADVDRTEKTVERARLYLYKTWTFVMRTHGHDFQLPSVLNGSRALFSMQRSRCETSLIYQFDNAEYCPADNSITYDGDFVAGLSKTIAGKTQSSGQFAAIVVIAHENGHALQYQLGMKNRFVFPNEQNADCFAGATAYQMQLDRQLQPKDVEEAKAALTLLADNKVAGPFDNAHGNAFQRVTAFMAGYTSGPNDCSAEFKSQSTPWRPPLVK